MQKSQKNEKAKIVYDRSSKTVLFLPTILIFLFYTGSSTYVDSVSATQKALLFGLIFVILSSIMFLPNGLIQRPSVFLWKSITGMSFFYLAVLIYFVYQNKESTISIIRTYFDKSLGQYNYEQVSYGNDCRLYASENEDPFLNVRYAFFDLFAFAHAAGWFVKTLVVRDFNLLFFESVAFQLIQYSLRNVLNNFKECWWDHVIVDVFGCNLFGIILGLYVIDRFKLQRYKWSFRDAPIQSSSLYQVKYFITHWDLSQLEMKSFATLKKYLQLSWFTLFFQANDLTVFFLKYIYEIPPSNYLVTLRVIVIGLLCVNASKQFYHYLIKRQNILKINCFIIHMIVLTQIFLIWKHGKNTFSHAYLSPLGCIFLGSLLTLFVILFCKILISDFINIKKAIVITIQKKPKNKELLQFTQKDTEIYSNNKKNEQMVL